MNHVWKIYDLKRKIADGMVTEVTYTCESEHSGSGTRSIGDITLITGSSSDSSFIEFNDLTESTVLGWVYSEITESDIENSNSASIATMIERRKAVEDANGVPW